jgi:hypothetical protein
MMEQLGTLYIRGELGLEAGDCKWCYCLQRNEVVEEEWNKPGKKRLGTDAVNDD